MSFHVTHSDISILGLCNACPQVELLSMGVFPPPSNGEENLISPPVILFVSSQ